MRSVIISLLIMLLPAVKQAAAQPRLKTTVSTQQILIGEPVKLQWEAELPEAGFIRWPSYPDSMPHIEWLERSPVDTQFSGSAINRLRQQYVFTSFDSGRWVLPAAVMVFTPVGSDSAWQLKTDSVVLTVGYQPDSTGELRDIKPIRQAAPPDQTLYWLAGIAALVVLLAAWVLFRRWRRRSAAIPQTGAADPYQAALQALDELATWPLTTAAEVHRFHVKLYDTGRDYLAACSGMPFRNQTTDGVLVHLRRLGLEGELLSASASALRSCDAVKFARYVPAADQCAQSRQALLQLVRFVHEKYQKPPSA